MMFLTQLNAIKKPVFSNYVKNIKMVVMNDEKQKPQISF
jgi:hypothetical protein